MKRQLLIGLVAGSLFAFAGMALAQGTPASAPAAATTTPKAAATHATHKKASHHKKSKKKKMTPAPAAHTK